MLFRAANYVEYYIRKLRMPYLRTAANAVVRAGDELTKDNFICGIAEAETDIRVYFPDNPDLSWAGARSTKVFLHETL